MDSFVKIVTSQEFKQARRRLKLSTWDLAHVLNTDPKTIRKWERASTYPPNPVACRVLEWMTNDGFWPPEAENMGK